MNFKRLSIFVSCALLLTLLAFVGRGGIFGCSGADLPDSGESDAIGENQPPVVADDPPVVGDPDSLATEWYFRRDERMLPDQSGTTIRGLKITNGGLDDVTLQTLDIALTFHGGWDGSDSQFLIFHDIDGDGYFAGFDVDPEGFGPENPEFIEPRLFDYIGLSSTMTVSLDSRTSVVVEAGASTYLGFFLWRNGTRNLGVEFDIVDGSASRVVGDDVPIEEEDDPPPEEDEDGIPPIEEECTFMCDETSPWKICYVPDYSWTDVNDYKPTANCPTPEESISYSTSHTILRVVDVKANEDVVKIDFTPPAACTSSTLPVMLSPKVANDKPTGEHSSACESTIVIATVDICCPDMTKVLRKQVASCPGTMIKVALTPVVCCNTDCNVYLKGELNSDWDKIFDAPPGEDNGLTNEACEGTQTRVDPRSIYDDTTSSGGDSAGSANTTAMTTAFMALKTDGVIDMGSMLECAAGICTGVCMKENAVTGAMEPGAAKFRYKFYPAMCGESMTVSQFSADGSGSGRIGIERRNGYTSDGPSFPNMGHSSHHTSETIAPGPPMTSSMGRDLAVQQGSTPDPSLNSGFIYLRPVPDSSDTANNSTKSFECSFVVFSACKRPIVVVKICPMKVLPLKIKVHVPDKKGPPAGGGAAPARTMAEVDLIGARMAGRLKELFGQACIAVTVEVAMYSTNADGVTSVGLGDLYSMHGDTSAGTLNIFAVNTLNLGGPVAVHRDNAPNTNASGGEGHAIGIPLEYMDATGMNGDAERLTGERLLCSEVTAHEVGHALGLSHIDGDRQMVPSVTDSTMMASADRRIMAGSQNSNEANTQPRYCWPSFLRFSCQARMGDDNEIKKMRETLVMGADFN